MGKSGRSDRRLQFWAILYRIIAARPPFQATRFEILEQVRDTDLEATPREFDEHLEQLEAICLKCSEKDPAAAMPQRRTRGGIRHLLRKSRFAEREISPNDL